MQVTFNKLRTWAIVPDEPQVDRQASRSERDLLAQEFRYSRVARLPADCPPWVMGQQLGWLIRSPITVRMSPIEDVEFSLPDGEDLRTVAQRLQVNEMWQRDEHWIATPGASWMRRFDFQGEDGWEGMFLPNGSGTVEWRLGWALTIPERYFLLVMGAGSDVVDVPLGILPAATVNRMAGRGGFSLAVRPTISGTVNRGDTVARIVLLHQDSLQAKSIESELGHGD